MGAKRTIRPVFGRRYILGFGSCGKMPTKNRGSRVRKTIRPGSVREWMEQQYQPAQGLREEVARLVRKEEGCVGV